MPENWRFRRRRVFQISGLRSLGGDNMNVQDMVRNWNAWGVQDPMFAILTDQDKAQGRWKVDDFFATGEQQVKQRLEWLQSIGIRLKFGRALDFGCGIGRLTNALARYFEEVHGVDISSSMIERARQLCKFPDRIQYFHNTASDLSLFQTGKYDFIYSEIVLQHIPTRYQLTYISDFLRLLSPDGIALLQTVRTIGWRAVIPDFAVEAYRLLKHGRKAHIPMYAIRPETLKETVASKGLQVLLHETFRPREVANRFWCDVYVIGSNRTNA